MDRSPTVPASLIATFGMLFDLIDVDENGEISLDEYKSFYGAMSKCLHTVNIHQVRDCSRHGGDEDKAVRNLPPLLSVRQHLS